MNQFLSNEEAFAALRYKNFRFFACTQFLYTSAVLIQEVILGYYLYELTGDPLALGIIGLLEAIPYLTLALFGGHIADKFDKRKIVLICISSMMLLTLILMKGLSISSNENAKYLIYTIVFGIGICRGFMSPSWSSLKPFLVEEKHFTNAATWSSQFWQAGMLLGPAVSGFLYAWLGLEKTLITVLFLFGLSLICVYFIDIISKVERKESEDLWQSLKAGFSFVRKTKIMYYAIALDMFSVLFGGVVAILPVYAKDILKVGAEGLGIMRAAPGVGALITMFLLTFYPPTSRAWRNLLLAITGFGLATLVFAVSKNFTISIIALFLTGAFDSISVVIRQTILNLLPPIEMRGRVSSINGIFVSCSNELGAFESGLAAKLLGTVNSVIFGASATLLIIAVVYLKTKDLLSINLQKLKLQNT